VSSAREKKDTQTGNYLSTFYYAERGEMMDTIIWVIVVLVLLSASIYLQIGMRNTALFYREDAYKWRQKFWEEEDKVYSLRFLIDQLNTQQRKDDDS
jgi:hypothetical protein